MIGNISLSQFWNVDPFAFFPALHAEFDEPDGDGIPAQLE
jgi:hypothetical protein